MFGELINKLKILAFQKGVKSVEYDLERGEFTLKRYCWKAVVTANLVETNNKTQLSFSGDVITSDREALRSMVEALWNVEIPKFKKNGELRRELWGDRGIERKGIYVRDMCKRIAGMPNV